MNDSHVISTQPLAAVLDVLPPWARDNSSELLLATSLSGILALAFLTLRPRHKKDKTAITELGTWSILFAWKFFEKRYDFLHGNWDRLKEHLFSFKVLQHTVVAVSGDEGRRVFFNDRHLDFFEGYAILQGGAPRMEEHVTEQEGYKPEKTTSFNKQLAWLSTKERMEQFNPILLDDIHRTMARRMPSKEGIVDPFKDIFLLIVQMTMRNFTCPEIADDHEAVDYMWKIFTAVETGVTPTALLLPWLPSKAKAEREKNTLAMIGFLVNYVEKRRAIADPTSTEAIDILIQKKMDTQAIIGFLMILIFAAITNAAVSVCWILIYLEAHPEWKQKATAEIEALLANHVSGSSAEPLHKRLAAVPMDAWEAECPVIDVCLRETLRLTINGSTLRRNTHDDMMVGEQVVKRGWFLVYSPADIHRDERVYPDAAKFDPTRHESGREQGNNVPYGFLGWGAGRHPCTGMRYAKLEIKFIVAIFLVGYKYELVDKSGKYPKELPIPNMNDLHRASPKGDPVFFKYKRLVD